MRHKLIRFVPHASFAALSLALVLATHAGFAKNYALQRQLLQKQSVKNGVTELAKRWNSLAFTNSYGVALADVALSKLDWQTLHFSDRQQSSLTNRLREVFDYLTKPEFEDYYRLKAVGFNIRFGLNSAASNVLARNYAMQTNQGEQPEQQLRKVWDAVSRASGTELPGRLIALCPTYVRHETSQSNSYTAILKGKAAIGLSVMAEAIEPGFYYDNQTNSVASDNLAGTFFHLSFFARTSTSTNAGPMYLSLYWSEADGNWALSRLFADRLLNFHAMF